MPDLALSAGAPRDLQGSSRSSGAGSASSQSRWLKSPLRDKSISRPVVIRPTTSGRCSSITVARPSCSYSSPPSTVLAISSAVVCSGMGFAEVAGEEHLAERRAALGAVFQRQAAGQAEEGQRRAHRLAGAQRIDAQGLVGLDDPGHVRPSPAGLYWRSRAPSAVPGARAAIPGCARPAPVAGPVRRSHRIRHSRSRVRG